MKHDKPWRQTYTGRRVHPLDVKPEDVSIHDIAHHLSQLGRYGGSLRDFESVAEHSTLMARYVMQHVHYNYQDNGWNISPTRIAKHALLHDAPEAYIQDQTRPLKIQLYVKDPETGEFISFKEMEDRITRVINPVFGLAPTNPPIIDDMDDRITRTEANAGMTYDPAWILRHDGLPCTIEFWHPARAEREFMQTFNELWSRESSEPVGGLR